MKKRIFLSVLLLSLLLCIATGCREEPPRCGEGCGMFDNATEIKISYKEETYAITDSEKVEQLIQLSRSGKWKEAPKPDYSKEDCEIKVEYIGARATLWISDHKKYGMIDLEHVIVPEDIRSFIMDEIEKD